MTNYELIDLMVCLATCVYFAGFLLGAGFGPGPSSRDAGATKASLAYRAGMAWLACFDRSGRPKEPGPAREPLGTSSGPPLDPLWTPFCPSADVFWTRFLLGFQAPISAYFAITYVVLVPFIKADKSPIGHFVPGGPGELRGVAGRMIELGKAVAIGGRRGLPRLWRSTRQYTAPPQPLCRHNSILTSARPGKGEAHRISETMCVTFSGLGTAPADTVNTYSVFNDVGAFWGDSQSYHREAIAGNSNADITGSLWKSIAACTNLTPPTRDAVAAYNWRAGA